MTLATTANDISRPAVGTHSVTLDVADDFDGWRQAARALASNNVAVENIVWSVAGDSADLFSSDSATAQLPAVGPNKLGVPKPFLDLARSAICHSDPERFALLYTALLRSQSHPGLIDDRADPLMTRLNAMAKDVRRDIHKMRAFVRFREIAGEDGEPHYIAWFEPDHNIVRTNAKFFVDRFANMRWSILTPAVSIHWDGETLTESPGAAKSDAPDGDAMEDVWKSYYKSIFNPARVKVKAMGKEMPRKYWKNMPETALIPELIAGAQHRESTMIDSARVERAAPGGNRNVAWEALRQEAAQCTRCPLYCNATQTVFGEGPVDAEILFVGEQPGDREDLAGRPFVGPAGQLFDRALADAGIDRSACYVTNAVKHFKFEPRGDRRIHRSPSAGEIDACRWWLEEERQIVLPRVTIALGATAARSVFGKPMKIGASRGRQIECGDGSKAWITVHPSYLLRLPDIARAEAYSAFVDDLAAAANAYIQR